MLDRGHRAVYMVHGHFAFDREVATKSEIAQPSDLDFKTAARIQVSGMIVTKDLVRFYDAVENTATVAAQIFSGE